MIDLKKITVGTDAEVPMYLKNGEPFPVTGIIPGTKHEPVPMKGLGDGFFVQQDNVMAEFNVPPAKSPLELHLFVQKAVKALNTGIPKTMIFGWQKASVVYKEAFLNHDEVLTFGCEPDYNAYTLEENPMPRSKNPNLRTAAAHVHVGWPNPNNEDRLELVKLLDFFLALVWARWDDPVRKEMYGKPGAFRPKEYGVEYRVLGNFWVPDHASSIFSGVEMAAKAVNDGYKVPELVLKSMTSVIESGDISKASRELRAEMSNFGLFFQ
jgi:hypothetical protein